MTENEVANRPKSGRVRGWKAVRFAQDHGRDIGSSVMWHLSLGAAHLNVEVCRGVYGLPHTRSLGLRMWWA